MSTEAWQASAPVGILVLDDASKVVSASQEAQRVLETTEGALVGRPIATLVGVGTRFFLQTHLFTSLALRGRVDEVYVSLLTASGTPVSVVLSAQRLPAQGTFRDVLAWMPVQRRHLVEHDLLRAYAQLEAAATHEREATARAAALEAQMAIRERMASIGTLAASVAHELNNPLAYVTANLELIEADARLPDESRAMLRDAVQGVTRIREIVGTLRRLTRVDVAKREPTSLDTVVDVAIKLAGAPVRQEGRLDVDVASPAPVVLGDEGRLCQVLVNLLVNAAQALPRGRPGNVVAVRVGREGANAVVEVQDNGTGIDPAVEARIFEPFFTTKPAGEGTGLGLAVCAQIVESMGGSIGVQSVHGEGTTFRVSLPELHAPVRNVLPAAAPTPSPASGAAPATPRLLLVEDDDAVARVIERTLRGAQLLRCVSGHQAYDVVQERGGDAFDAVLCDLMMPDGTGMELHARLRQAWPTLAEKMIFMSGGAFSAEARAFLDRTRQPWLEKPFQVGALRQAVAQMVAQRR